MAETANIYTVVAEHLKGKTDLAIKGPYLEFAVSPRAGYHKETQTYLIAPNKPVPFEREPLDNIVDQLRIDGLTGWSAGAGWNGESPRTFIFGARTYSQSITKFEDLSDPIAYLAWLQKHNRVPNIDSYGRHSEREVVLRIYPDRNYARLLGLYLEGSVGAGNQNEYSHMEGLTHKITEEQLRVYQRGNISLIRLPEAPEPPGRPWSPTIN